MPARTHTSTCTDELVISSSCIPIIFYNIIIHYFAQMLITKTVCTMHGVHMHHTRHYKSGASACGALSMRIYAHCSCYIDSV